MAGQAIWRRCTPTTPRVASWPGENAITVMDVAGLDAGKARVTPLAGMPGGGHAHSIRPAAPAVGGCDAARVRAFSVTRSRIWPRRSPHRLGAVFLRGLASTLVVLATYAVTDTPAKGTAGPIAFTSPSGKIECALSRIGATCANDKTYRTPPPPESDCGSGSSAVNVDRHGAGLVCIGNDLGAELPLPYGRTLRRGRFSCTSRRSGMSCDDRQTGRGFHLNRRSWRFF
jgi:hypothetical protein